LARAPLRDTDPVRVGRYRLTARLGAGGLGVVYLGSGSTTLTQGQGRVCDTFVVVLGSGWLWA